MFAAAIATIAAAPIGAAQDQPAGESIAGTFLNPEKNNEHDFCVTRMQFIDTNSVDVEFWSFGKGNVANPQRLDNLTVRIRN